VLQVISVVGARPQFVKAGVVSRRWQQLPDVRERIVHTGQHYDRTMSGVFFDELDIPEPAWNLGVNQAPHGAMSGRMLEGLEQLFLEQRPDVAVVYGDTNSTLAGALAAAKLHIPVAHVEAGLRSFNRCMPEEINRVVADHVSHFLYCPTPAAMTNLRNEGIGTATPAERFTFHAPAEVVLSGDVMYESFLYYRDALHERRRVFNALDVPDTFLLCTLHREENTNDPGRLRALVEGLGEASDILPVVLPLHPRTRASISAHGLSFGNRVLVIETVSYLTMVWLLDKCRLVVTDSGGLQKEAYFARRPCLTLRSETEWVETLATGWNRLCDVRREKLAECVAAVLDRGPSDSDYRWDLYGTSTASDLICRHLLKRLRPED
jgi:UDP-GlcNAc3NAcA epimerase